MNRTISNPVAGSEGGPRPALGDSSPAGTAPDPRGRASARTSIPTIAAIAVVVSCLAPTARATAQTPAATDGPGANGPGANGSGPIPARLQEILPDLIRNAGVPGAAAAWVEDARVAWVGAFGVRDAATGAPVVPGTVFEAASLSKPVVAYVAMRLAARGELDLDAPLWDAEGYDRLAHDERARRITARMVLSHTSGLPNWGGSPLELNGNPGATWNYSGEGFVLLATMLERRTGRSLDELARREVFDPLGMSSSSFVWRDAYDETAASPHDLVGRPTDKNRPREANAAASLHTTAPDYARFVLAVMQGEGLPAGAAEEMLEAQAGIAGWGNRDTWEHLSWSLGWGIQRGDGEEAIWHWGDNGNFRCFVIGYPESGEAFVVFTNSNNGLSIVGPLLDEIFEDTHWAVRYLDYPAWDKPRQVARRALWRAFLVDGGEAGWTALRRLAEEFPADVAENETQRVAGALGSDGDEATRLAVLEWAAERFASASSQRALGEAYTALGEYAQAVDSYARAAELDPELEEELAPRLAWLREGLAVGAELEEYAGSYGPRTISLSGDRLLYSREGASSETLLVPLTPDLFGLESLRTFRIRFERDEDGRVVRIVGLYSDGRVDRSERTE